MLDENFISITALIDNSGSMANLNTQELAEGLTKMIKEQCIPGKEVIFYGATFSDNFKIFADGVNANNITITKNDIMPDGMTALTPAFARMIKYTGNKLDQMQRKPGKVIFILLSDGEQTVNQFESATRTIDDKPYEGADANNNLKNLIEEHTNIWKWTFLYLGTNYDSLKAGKTIGISPEQCINYAYTPNGSKNVMRVCSTAMTSIARNNFNGFTQNDRTTAMNENEMNENN